MPNRNIDPRDNSRSNSRGKSRGPQILAVARLALPLIALFIFWFTAPTGKPPQPPLPPAPEPVEYVIGVAPDIAAKALAAIDPVVAKQEWQKVLQTCQPIALDLETRMQAQKDVRKRLAFKQALQNPLLFQALATAKLGRDAQPLYDKFLELYSVSLSSKKIAGLRYDQACNLEDIIPSAPGAERRRLHVRLISILEAGKDAIEQAHRLGEDINVLSLSLPGTLGEIHTRLVSDKGVNYLQESKDKLQDAERDATTSPHDEQARRKLTQAQQSLKEVEAHIQAAEINFALVTKLIRTHPEFNGQGKTLLSVLKVRAVLLEAQNKTTEVTAIRAEMARIKAANK